MSATDGNSAGLCIFLLLGATIFALYGAQQFVMARIERRRLRITLDYVRRSKLSQKELKRFADEAWEKLHADSVRVDREQAARHQKFWTEFAAAYGKATGQTFPKPPPEILPTKLPPRGSA